MSKDRESTSLQEFLFKTLGFLASSAEGCLTEPKLYGPFRLIDTISRLCDLPRYSSDLKEDPFLKKIKEKIDEKKYLVMSDEQAFKEFVKKIVRDLVREYQSRKKNRQF